MTRFFFYLLLYIYIYIYIYMCVCVCVSLFLSLSVLSSTYSKHATIFLNHLILTLTPSNRPMYPQGKPSTPITLRNSLFLSFLWESSVVRSLLTSVTFYKKKSSFLVRRCYERERERERGEAY